MKDGPRVPDAFRGQAATWRRTRARRVHVALPAAAALWLALSPQARANGGDSTGPVARASSADLAACQADPASLDEAGRERLGVLDRRSMSAPESLDAGECLALSLLGAGDPTRAAERFDALALRAGTVPVAGRGPGRGGRTGGSPGELATAAAASAHARAAGFYTQAARAWLEAGVPARSVVSARAALALEPDDLGVRILLARATLAQGQPRDALSTLSALPQAPQARPPATGDVERLATAWTLRAGASRRLGDYPAALQDIAIALALNADDPDAILERGIVRARGGDLPAARVDWEKVINLAPNSHAAYLARQDEDLLAADPEQP